MDFYRACLKKIRACPFLKATGLGLFHDFFFLGALYYPNIYDILYALKIIQGRV